MFPRRRFALVLLVASAVGSRCAAQSSPAPFYALPEDGAWVEYEWTAVGQDQQKTTGTLRISCVGRLEIRGEPHCWVELKKEFKLRDRPVQQVRKLLVAEKTFRKGGPVQDAVVEVYDRHGTDGPVTRLSPARVADFLSLGLSGPEASFKEVQEKEEIETPLGKFVARQVVARGKEGRRFDYYAWLTPEAPFGWCKIELKENTGTASGRTVFTALAVKKGKDAKSELDETKAR
jgi:hypothetical protein